MAAVRQGRIQKVTIDTDSNVGFEIIVDATITEEHTYEAEVSSYPIENGTDIVDNVRVKPISISLDCLFTDTPMEGAPDDPLNTIQDPFANSPGIVDPFAAGAIADPFAPNFQNVILPTTETFLGLLKIFNSKKEITIETSLDRYESMVMTSIAFPRSAAIGYALSAKIQFRQVIIVNNLRSTVSVPVRAAGEDHKHKGKYLEVFSALVKDRAKYKDYYKILCTDNVGPDGSRGGEWDHYENNLALIADFGNRHLIPVDGYVDLPEGKVYHPYSGKIGVQQTEEALKKVTGRDDHYDAKTNQWLDKEGKPVTQSPAAVAQRQEQKAIATKAEAAQKAAKSLSSWGIF